MNRAAWWTCALLVLELAVSHARIYDRCELARDLRAQGVHSDHISTWVCIAYHESRFDTSANNPHSGDHGLFQISELYWCGVHGAGKACGLSCAALRDDDITDDLKCALQVHEEHTRLQGDGFLAWVVYPQHCKHNTKKYLTDCNVARSFNFNSYDNRYKSKATDTWNSNNLNIDQQPAYLRISSFLRGTYGKRFDPNQPPPSGGDWYNYKYDKVDELKLPGSVVRLETAPVDTRTTTMTTTTTTAAPYIPPVKVWRVIETNQFRKKAFNLNRNTAIPPTRQENNVFIKNTLGSSSYKPFTESTTHKSLITVTVADILPKVRSTITSYKSPPMLTSTIKPVNITNIAYKSPAFTTSYKSRTTAALPTRYTSPTGSSYNYEYYTSAAGNIFPNFTTTVKPTSPAFVFTFPTTTSKPTTVPTTALTFPSRSYTYRTPSYSTATVKPSITTFKTRITSNPSTSYKTTLGPTTSRLTTPWYTFTSRLRTFAPYTTTSKYPQSTKFVTITTTRPTFPIPVTQRPTFWTYTTQKPAFTFTNPQKHKFATSTTQKAKFSTSTQGPVSQTTTRPSTQRTTRATQNIFDLYLNPTQRPMLPPYSFSPRDNKKFKVSIFFGGTTTVPSVNNAERNLEERNQIRREIPA